MGKSPASPRLVVLSAGGTGGHLFPAVAFAEILERQGMQPFFIIDKRTAPLLEKDRHFSFTCLDLPSYKGPFSAKIVFFIAFLKTLFSTLIWYKRQKPCLTIGFGGYPSLIAVLTSILMRVPLFLHEQNSYLGRVNRWTCFFAKKILVTLPLDPQQSQKHKSRILSLGHPIRKQIIPYINAPYKPLSKGVFSILVIGGSQGASAFSTLIPAALAQLPPQLRDQVCVAQQCRADLLQDTQRSYEKLGVQARVAPFFQDMGQLLAQATLVIARAGASTLIEIAAVGRPALFIPLETAMDNHQLLNATLALNKGGAWIWRERDQAQTSLSPLLENILSSVPALEKAAHNMHYLYKELDEQALSILIKASTP